MHDSNDGRSVFVVLGASGDIGSQVARRLVKAGHAVLLASRPSVHLNTLATELAAPVSTVDATSFEQVRACFEMAVNEFGSVDGAANCVGSLLLKPAHMTSESEWHETVAANLTSAFATVSAAASTMKQGGSIVLMSSAAARIGLANHEAIAAAKAGVIGLARSAAASYAARGLRFNVVAPGLVKTKLTRKIWQGERAASMSQSMHALGRLGEPDEVASLIAWLLDSANTWLTGEVFSIDGGLGNVRSNQRPTTK